MSEGSLLLARVQDAIYTWIKTETEGEIEEDHIIWRNQSEPLPSRPCVTMKIIDGPRPLGIQDNIVYKDTGRFTIGGQREMTVSIQVFGNTQFSRPMAYQLLVDLHSSLSKLTVLDRLRKAGVSVQRKGDPNNITALEETEYEERAQVDILFGVSQNLVDDPGIIEHVGPIDNNLS